MNVRQVHLLDGLSLQLGDDGFWFVFDSGTKHALQHVDTDAGSIISGAVFDVLSQIIDKHGVELQPPASPPEKATHTGDRVEVDGYDSTGQFINGLSGVVIGYTGAATQRVKLDNGDLVEVGWRQCTKTDEQAK